MKRPPRMAGQPGAHLGMLVGGVVVEDRVHQLSGRHGGLDAVQKADELLVAMPRHALADHCAVQHIERRKQRRRAVPEVIMGHRPSPPLLHRQARLGAVERLNLRLLVDRQDEAMSRRIEIQPDHVAQFGAKGRVVRQLEPPHPVRLQAVRRPDPLHRAQ